MEEELKELVQELHDVLYSLMMFFIDQGYTA